MIKKKGDLEKIMAGFYECINGGAVLYNLSVLNIVNWDEHEKNLKLIQNISKRNPGHMVKISLEVKENKKYDE